MRAVPNCQFCDKPLDIGGQIKDGMHAECYDEFGRELDAAFPDPDNTIPILPITQIFEDDFDWLSDIDVLVDETFSEV